MHENCVNCLHLKKVPGETLVFCKMNRLPTVYEIAEHEVRENGVLKLHSREIFGFAKICPNFVTMEDDEENTKEVAQFDSNQIYFFNGIE